MALSLKVKKGEFLRIGEMVIYFKTMHAGHSQIAILGDKNVRVERITSREDGKDNKPNYGRVVGTPSK